MAWKSSSYSSSSINYSHNQVPYIAPQTTERATHVRSVNYATAYSGAPWNYCAACGEKLERDARFCHECGKDVGKIQLVNDLIPTKCTCKRAIKKEYRFCPGCKAPVDKSWMNVDACDCGTVILIEAKICVSCGKKGSSAIARRKIG